MREVVGWDQISLPHFFAYSTATFTAVRSLTYPTSLLKTRQQVGTVPDDVPVRAALRQIAAREGVRGLYRGFAVTCGGVLPAQAVYLSVLEFVRARVPVEGESRRAFVAGGCASLCSTTVGVPADVLAQRLMLQQEDGAARRYRGGVHALVTIAREEGVARGLWRGYGATLLTLVPSSALWWASYAAARELLGPALHVVLPERAAEAAGGGLTTSLSGAAAGLVTAVATTPLDVVKTRLQTSSSASHLRDGGDGILPEARRVLAEGGPRALMRGVVPRAGNMMLTGSLMISAFEAVKRWSALPATSDLD